MLKKVRKDKKGFTLMELIVVLVILAILAAILVPALLGWIDKAKEKQIVVNGRTVMMAAQTVASEKYGTSSPIGTKDYTITEASAGVASPTGDAIIGKEIAALADIDADAYTAVIKIVNNKVTEVTYTEGSTTVKWTQADGWVKQ